MSRIPPYVNMATSFIPVLMYSVYVDISQVNGKGSTGREKSYRTREEISKRHWFNLKIQNRLIRYFSTDNVHVQTILT